MLGRDLNLDPSQIRKDFETISIAGKPKVGYSVSTAVNAIERFLGWDRQKSAILAGADSLGLALLASGDFGRYGLRIVGVFDSDERLIGMDAKGREVRPLGFLPGFARSMGVQVGIIALPAKEAQMAADLMVNGGIRAIWNVAPIAVQAPERVAVENQDLFYPLAVLTSRLARAMEMEAQAKAAAGTADPAAPGKS